MRVIRLSRLATFAVAGRASEKHSPSPSPLSAPSAAAKSRGSRPTMIRHSGSRHSGQAARLNVGWDNAGTRGQRGSWLGGQGRAGDRLRSPASSASRSERAVGAGLLELARQLAAPLVAAEGADTHARTGSGLFLGFAFRGFAYHQLYLGVGLDSALLRGRNRIRCRSLLG